MDEKIYERYDGICNYLLKILSWNYKEGRKFIIDNAIDTKDKSQLLILHLMDKLNKNLGYEIYYKGTWLETLSVKHASKINIKHYKKKEAKFIYNLKDFVSEMCITLNINKEDLENICRLYFMEV